jgi:hypothetical protein
VCVLRAKVVPDRVIRRRSIRMICAGPPVPAALRDRGRTVAAGPADTDDTIRLENPGTGLAHGRHDRGVEDLTGRDIVACPAHSPGRQAARAGARLEYATSLGCRQEWQLSPRGRPGVRQSDLPQPLPASRSLERAALITLAAAISALLSKTAAGATASVTPARATAKPSRHHPGPQPRRARAGLMRIG